jgi:hypothetical protein
MARQGRRRNDHIHWMGKRVRVDLDSGPEYGELTGITPRGHRVRLDSGRTVYAAWWRLSLEATER